MTRRGRRRLALAALILAVVAGWTLLRPTTPTGAPAPTAAAASPTGYVAEATVRLEPVFAGVAADNAGILVAVDREDVLALARSDEVTDEALAIAADAGWTSVDAEHLAKRSVTVDSDRSLTVWVAAIDEDVARRCAQAAAEATLERRGERTLAAMRDEGQRLLREHQDLRALQRSTRRLLDEAEAPDESLTAAAADLDRRVAAQGAVLEQLGDTEVDPGTLLEVTVEPATVS